jgi:hypothetical protein
MHIITYVIVFFNAFILRKINICQPSLAEKSKIFMVADSIDTGKHLE